MSGSKSTGWRQPVDRKCFAPPLEQPKKYFAVPKGQHIFRLCCPHCDARCLTFKEYRRHLVTQKHRKCLNRCIQSIEEKRDCTRREQKVAQIKADEADKLLGISSNVLKYCKTCDLNFRQEERKHRASKLHVELKHLLEPVCETCNYKAKNRGDYERHLCSLDHVKKEDLKHSQENHYDWEEKESTNIPAQMVASSSSISTSPAVAISLTEPSPGPFTTSSGPCRGPVTSSSAPSPNVALSSCRPLPAPVLSSSQGSPEDNSAPVPYEGEDIITKVPALWCPACGLYFECDEFEGDETAAKYKHCKTDAHVRNYAKYLYAIERQSQNRKDA